MKKGGAAKKLAAAKNQKDGLLELQQGQKIKKMGCWNSSKAKNQKNGAAGTPASPKNKKKRHDLMCQHGLLVCFMQYRKC